MTEENTEAVKEEVPAAIVDGIVKAGSRELFRVTNMDGVPQMVDIDVLLTICGILIQTNIDNEDFQRNLSGIGVKVSDPDSDKIHVP